MLEYTKVQQRFIELRVQGHTLAEIARITLIPLNTVAAALKPSNTIRQAVIERYNGTCRACNTYVGTHGHVHHKIIDYDYNNENHLELLCKKCHGSIHISAYNMRAETTDQTVARKELEAAKEAQQQNDAKRAEIIKQLQVAGLRQITS